MMMDAPPDLPMALSSRSVTTLRPQPSMTGTLRSSAAALKRSLPPPPMAALPPTPQEKEKAKKEEKKEKRKFFARHGPFGDETKDKAKEKDAYVEPAGSAWFDDYPTTNDRHYSPTLSSPSSRHFPKTSISSSQLRTSSSPPPTSSSVQTHTGNQDLVQHIIPPAELSRLGVEWEREADLRDQGRKKKSTGGSGNKAGGSSSIFSLSSESTFACTTALNLNQDLDTFETSLRPPPRKPKKSKASSLSTVGASGSAKVGAPSSSSGIPIRRKTSNGSSIGSIPRKGALSRSNTISSRSSASGTRVEKKPSFLDMTTGRKVMLDIDEGWEQQRERRREKDRDMGVVKEEIGAMDSFFEPLGRESFDSEFLDEDSDENLNATGNSNSRGFMGLSTPARTPSSHRRRGSFLEPSSLSSPSNGSGSSSRYGRGDVMTDRLSLVGMMDESNMEPKDSFLELNSASIRGMDSFDITRKSVESFVQ
ncbi:hypothetical protein M422DRAFT_50278 [Sphaerobolus stellatus SS14]|uniref:Uncharacterized protein n=1 Tax=Sphaerobolus stellatus (strain SS14) TaxID=990650 RepID=A0A0C9VJS0_SPHS4|nr:hypothetical protein M422DRAFT_50278 [Sphaerobolus stellatus SS14]